jgi:phospholipid/cholesterol/gamma-HCH transport system substrate-binding protein
VQSRTVEIWVGVFVALGLAALFFMAMKVSNLSQLEGDGDVYHITAHFDNVGSLRTRASVSMGGVRIGRVSAIHLDTQGFQAVVDMQIEKQYANLPDDSSASILTAGILGEQYVGLTPGGSDVFLKEGDRLELTQSAMVLEQLISHFLFNKAEGDKDRKSTGSDKSDS